MITIADSTLRMAALIPASYECFMVLGVLSCLIVNARTLKRSWAKWRQHRKNPEKDRIYVWSNLRTDFLLTLIQFGGLAIAVQRLILMFQGNALAVGFLSCEIATVRTGMSIAAALISRLNNRDRLRIVALGSPL